MYFIDTQTYDKTHAIPYNPEKQCGYQPRPAGKLALRSILVHSTNGAIGSSFTSEAQFIMNSRDISSHYLIGKDGRIVQFIDPHYWIAYHAGCVKATLWSNPFAIGIEIHNTPAEGHIHKESIDALDWLVRQLMRDFIIPVENIDTHRNVAIYCKDHPLAGKKGRKIDPSIWPDNEFYAWRSTLNAANMVLTYRVINPKGVNIRQSPQVNEDNIAGVLYYNDVFQSDILQTDEKHEIHTGSNGNSDQWAHIYKGISMGKPVDQLGFVSLSNLQAIG